MGLIFSGTKTPKTVIDLVARPADHFEDRGRTPRRRSPRRRSTGSPSRLRGRSRTPSSPTRGPVGAKPVHLPEDSPPGSRRRVFCVPSTKRRRGRRRPLQESLNNTVDIFNPPPVPKMGPGWAEVIKKKSGEDQRQARANFEKIKKNKRWADLSPAQQKQEVVDFLANKKKWKKWKLDQDIIQQVEKVEQTAEEAEETARLAASAVRRLERLKQRKGDASPKRERRRSQPNEESSAKPARTGKTGKTPKPPELKDSKPAKTGKTGKTGETPKPPEPKDQIAGETEDQAEAEATPSSSKNASLGQLAQESESSHGEKRSLQQAAEPGRENKAPSSSRQPQESRSSQSRPASHRPESHRSVTAPTSADPSKAANKAVPQRPSQQGRRSAMPSRPGPSEAEGIDQQGAASKVQGNAASSAKNSEAGRSIPRARSEVQTMAASSAKNSNRGHTNQGPSRAAVVRSSAKQAFQPSQLRQVTNAHEVSEGSSGQAPTVHSRIAEAESKAQQESSAKGTLKPGRRSRAVASGKPSVIHQPSQSRPKRTTLAPLTEANLESAAKSTDGKEYVLESGSAFDVQTVLNRGPGNNTRTVIEGMVPMSASELAEEEKRQKDSIREKLEEAEIREQEKLLVTRFQRGPGDNFRTNIEGMQPMNSEDIRGKEQRWKSYKRQELEDEEATKQDKLLRTEFNRGIGDMMRTNVEAMVPMTSKQVKEEARERLEDEEMRLQDELLKTRLNRGPGNMMRTVIEGMVSKSPGSMTPEEIRVKRQAYADEQALRKSAYASRQSSVS